MTDQERIREAVPRIIGWYSRSRRVLPWREDPQPYRVWVSEIMLQQTRIEAVIPYFRRFMAELPSVQALAAVDDDRLMKLWEGLGYYSRARNLKKAAQLLMKEGGGQLPDSAEALRRLPGIGDYTAGAIASIAFGRPEPAVDGNVLRVLSRLLRREEDVSQPAAKTFARELLRGCYPEGEAAALLTEGLMELGETLCLPKGEPGCPLCPLKELCLARKDGCVDRYPVVGVKKQRRTEKRTVLLLRRKDRFAIRRRPKEGLLAGLWEFPSLDGALGEDQVLSRVRELGLRPVSCRPCGTARHIFTHVEWHMAGYLLELEAEGGDFLWKTGAEIARDYPFPTALKFFRNLVLGMETE